ALRNALIAPVTVVMLYIPWLLSGVIVTEVFFAYKGFGSLLYEASVNSDVFLIEACAMVSVIVVVATQLASDLLYIALNPRINFRTALGRSRCNSFEDCATRRDPRSSSVPAWSAYGSCARSSPTGWRRSIRSRTWRRWSRRVAKFLAAMLGWAPICSGAIF